MFVPQALEEGGGAGIRLHWLMRHDTCGPNCTGGRHLEVQSRGLHHYSTFSRTSSYIFDSLDEMRAGQKAHRSKYIENRSAPRNHRLRTCV